MITSGAYKGGRPPSRLVHRGPASLAVPPSMNLPTQVGSMNFCVFTNKRDELLKEVLGGLILILIIIDVDVEVKG